MIKRQDFFYELPNHLIARYPTIDRSSSRLLFLDRQVQKISHHFFYQLSDFLRAGDLLIFNQSKVMKARFFAQKATGGRIEILIDRILNNHSALAHIKASKAPKAESILLIDQHPLIKVLEKKDNLYLIEFLQYDVWQLMEQFGTLPIPHYMERETEQLDEARYQTIYANQLGSAAAPTAGLHFDEALFQILEEKKIEKAFVTLHVGAGTFQPVRTENILEHQMHHEYFSIDSTTCEKIIAAKKRGSRIIAVGTTSVRTLESAALKSIRHLIEPCEGDTNLFIYPGYQFNIIDGLITNFHLPESTLLMLVCAFAGYEFTMNAYQRAIEQQYRFFSYGDAMLIL